jgi:hypothetical protein
VCEQHSRSRVHAMEGACKTQMAALHECKLSLGLLPNQCYPSTGYKGQCDAAEFAFKRCLAFAANRRDAKVLYDTQSPRQERVAANARLQKALKKYNQPCTP